MGQGSSEEPAEPPARACRAPAGPRLDVPVAMSHPKIQLHAAGETVPWTLHHGTKQQPLPDNPGSPPSVGDIQDFDFSLSERQAFLAAGARSPGFGFSPADIAQAQRSMSPSRPLAYNSRSGQARSGMERDSDFVLADRRLGYSERGRALSPQPRQPLQGHFRMHSPINPSACRATSPSMATDRLAVPRGATYRHLSPAPVWNARLSGCGASSPATDSDFGLSDRQIAAVLALSAQPEPLPRGARMSDVGFRRPNLDSIGVSGGNGCCYGPAVAGGVYQDPLGPAHAMLPVDEMAAGLSSARSASVPPTPRTRTCGPGPSRSCTPCTAADICPLDEDTEVQVHHGREAVGRNLRSKDVSGLQVSHAARRLSAPRREP